MFFTQSGFTLAEMLVVVAIIAILSSIALPSYKKYVTKAKTTEAKLDLSTAFTAQQVLYSDFGTYAYCWALYANLPDKASAPGTTYYIVPLNYYSYGFDVYPGWFGTLGAAWTAHSWGDYYISDNGGNNLCTQQFGPIWGRKGIPTGQAPDISQPGLGKTLFNSVVNLTQKTFTIGALGWPQLRDFSLASTANADFGLLMKKRTSLGFRYHQNKIT